MLYRLSARTLVLIRRLPQFLRFGVVGACGFAVDAGILSLLFWGLHWSPFVARVPSFLCAVSVTWMLNSIFTFENVAARTRKNFLLYLGFNVVGNGINLGVYTACLHLSLAMREYPPMALAIASICAMLFNYTSAKKAVFKKKA